MAKPPTPFPTTGYFGPAYFCDREAELKQLKQNIRGGTSTTLISLRRLGKTALIHHLFHHLGNEFICIYLDILPTESIGDMLNQLSTAIASEFSERSGPGKKIWGVIKSLRPVISYDSLSGTPLISIRSSMEESKKTMEELFAVLEEQPKRVIIAMDEFQQILEYPEKQSDAWLRSLVQHLGNVSFIFCGSQQQLMQDLFANPRRPFFRSTQFLKMEKLDEDVYRNFILKQFSRHSNNISAETVTGILHWADMHTYYVQLLCNRVYLTSGKKSGKDEWRREAAKILKEQEYVFIGYREMLTRAQWNLLKAVAFEGRVYQPTSAEFVVTHHLGNPATVLRSLGALQKMDLIYRESDPEGKSYYGVYDVLFRRWIRRADTTSGLPLH